MNRFTSFNLMYHFAWIEQKGTYVLFYFEYLMILKGDISTSLRFTQYDVRGKRCIAYAWFGMTHIKHVIPSEERDPPQQLTKTYNYKPNLSSFPFFNSHSQNTRNFWTNLFFKLMFLLRIQKDKEFSKPW